MEQSSLVKLQANFEVEIVWRGFELHPETPIGGMPVSALFPGKSVERMQARMEAFASEFGVAMVVPAHLSNTRRALTMAEYARDQGKLDEFRNQATRAYWLDGLNLERDEDLARIAGDSGLDKEDALAASLDENYVGRVMATRAEGMDRMVSGVPTLFMGGMPIVGCQRYETFEKVAKRAGWKSR